MSKSITIQRGDTLWALAKKHGTTISAFAKLNGIKNPNLIITGRKLKVPGHSGASTFEGPKKTPSKTPTKKPGSTGSTGGVTPSTGGINSSQKLANAARAAAMGMGGYNSQGLCATGVSRAISNAMGIKVWGNGNQIDNNLPKNKFKQINISLAEALKIPGLVLTWEKTSTRAGSIYGHTAITLGDGHSSASDFIENYTTNNGRSGFKVFMPI